MSIIVVRGQEKAGATAWGNSSIASPSKNARRRRPPGASDDRIVASASGTSPGSRWISEYQEKIPPKGGRQVAQIVKCPLTELHLRVGALCVVHELWHRVDSLGCDAGVGEVSGPVAWTAPDVDDATRAVASPAGDQRAVLRCCGVDVTE